jgi:plastocyanin
MIKTMSLVCAAAMGLAACGGSSYSSNTSSSSKPASSSSAAASGGGYGGGTKSSATKTTVASSSGGSSTTILMKDNFFQGKTITGKAGSTVKINLKNVGSNDHNFKIDSQKQADADVSPGKSATVSVKIPASGSVQFYCEYHKGLGMVGTVKHS